MHNILLIGAGQLGSRHLQGLAKSERPYHISVLEPSSANRQIAINRFQEVSGYNTHTFNAYETFKELPLESYDIAIVATNADIRASLTQKLVDNFEVRNIIFEKVAFQSEKQFTQILELLLKNNIKSWVNCPRRCFPFYHALRNYLSGSGSVKLETEGIDWGLACNGVHQIDLLAFLTGDSNYSPDKNMLDNEIYNSKRDGFIEFYGSISGSSSSGNYYTLTCKQRNDPAEKPYLKINLKTKNETIIIDESGGRAEYFIRGSNEPYKVEPVKMVFQSDLSAPQVSQILDMGESFLPTLEESFQIHKPLLKTLMEQYEKVKGIKIENLPIT